MARQQAYSSGETWRKIQLGGSREQSKLAQASITDGSLVVRLCSTATRRFFIIAEKGGDIRVKKMPPVDSKPEEPLEPDLALEIAHVLLIDIVGYSKLLVNEQIKVVRELNRVVRSTECFRAAEASGKLIRLPTGDGMALLFFSSPEQPVRCAIEIRKALQTEISIPLRMGIHSGPVNTITDVNDSVNVAGAGINIAQRILDCGDAGHILVSKHLADDLANYRQWQPYLNDLGECEVKHGLRVHVFNLCKDGIGNPAVPEKLRLGRRWKPQPHSVHPVKAARWPTSVIIVAMLLSGVALTVSALMFFHRSNLVRNPAEAVAPIPLKSIAVLPFQSYGDETQHNHLTEGVQDEILTDLAKVADLKVISRTSVMQYKTAAQRNLREIAKQLGVAHILEGSVQCIGNRVRVNAQLIDARSDAHLWAEGYDRNLADVFAVESEIAEKIVAQLKSKLSPQEKAAIEETPTKDLVAYDLYTRAKMLIENSVINLPLKASLFEAVELLNQALRHDPDFALAYYQLADAHDMLYFVGVDHTPARLAMANDAIQRLAALRPHSGETHLARAKHFYFGYLDYDHARIQLELAKKALPNDPVPFLLTGFIDRRQSRWDESTRNLEHAIELDPQNPSVLQQIARSYECLRRYAYAERALDRAIALAPEVAATRTTRAEIEFHWHGDARPLLAVIQTVVAENPRAAEGDTIGVGSNIAEEWFQISLCQRDFDAAQRALAILPIDSCHKETIPFPRAWCEGLAAQIRGDKAAARSAFTKVRDEATKLVREQPNYAEALCVLGMADAILGNKDDAIREGRRAVELLPVTKESIAGSLLIQYLGLIYAWTGEKDLAFEQLTTAARIPGYLSYGQLRFHPYFDPLRGDPRFDKIVTSLAPK